MCKRMIDRDKAGNGDDTLANRANLDTLNMIIALHGWPPKTRLKLEGSGVAIVLAHQPWFKAAEFNHYFALMASSCADGEECWETALLLLEQRIRRLARHDDDTLCLAGLDMRSDPRLSAYYFAIAHRMVPNGHKRIHLRCADVGLGEQVRDRIMAIQPKPDIDEEMLQFLIARGFDHPAPITLERFEIQVDPQIPRDRVLFRMD
jgi:hypothetical protein